VLKGKTQRQSLNAEDLLRGALPAQVADVYDAVDAAIRDHEKSKNADFKMIFRGGWRLIQHLAQESPNALRVWAFIAEHAGPSGALLVAQADIAAAIGVSTRTIRSHVRRLEAEGALITLRAAGGCVYCINPRHIWALGADQRRGAPFLTRSIFSAHTHGTLRKRLTVATFRTCDSGSDRDAKALLRMATREPSE
jgi:hypothetical protein